jgi:hypothetical protein
MLFSLPASVEEVVENEESVKPLTLFYQVWLW